jgi:hypothetical protein
LVAISEDSARPLVSPLRSLESSLRTNSGSEWERAPSAAAAAVVQSERLAAAQQQSELQQLPLECLQPAAAAHSGGQTEGGNSRGRRSYELDHVLLESLPSAHTVPSLPRPSAPTAH